MTADSRERFGVTADDYQRHRPTYPVGLVDWLIATTGLSPLARVADLGCGTGIASRMLAARGFAVVGVEPNADMLARAQAAGGGPTYVRGEAAATSLPDASVELVTAAQAFHWFELRPTLAEIDRILVGGGWACAFWNLRVDSPFNDDYEALLLRCSSEYAALSDMQDPRGRILHANPEAVCTELPHEDSLSWETVLGRARSASYVAHGVADPAAFERGLREAFERHAGADGRLRWVMQTVAAAWRATLLSR